MFQSTFCDLISDRYQILGNLENLVSFLVTGFKFRST